MGVPVVLGSKGIERDRRARPRRRRAAGAEGLGGRRPRGRLRPHHLAACSSISRGRTAIVCGGPPGSASAARRRSPGRSEPRHVRAPRARCSSARPSGSARSRSRATSGNPDDLARLVATAVERFGGVDVVVLNSGGPPRTGSFEFSDEQLRDAVELLLLSSIRLVRLCLPHLEASGHGRVIAITSSASRSRSTHWRSRAPSAPGSSAG